MVSPHRVRYNNIFSNELNIPDLIMCVAMESDNGETPSFLNREAVSSESYDGRYKRIHRFKFTESFSPKFSFFKSDFGNFEMDEVRAVLKWLTSKDTTSLLETYYDDSSVATWASIGGFVDLQTYKIANNRTIAITATWDSISPFALSDLYTVTKKITSTDNKITINIDTDDNQPIYPCVTIKNPSANITFRNVHTDFVNNSTAISPTIIKNNISSETITLDGTNRIVYSDRTGGRTFGDDFENWRWLELRDGKNEITVEGNCEVTLSWREVRKVGEY